MTAKNRPAKKPTKAALKEAVYMAAISWWKAHRPVTWMEADHIGTPSINCCSTADSILSEACAAARKAGVR